MLKNKLNQRILIVIAAAALIALLYFGGTWLVQAIMRMHGLG